MAVKRPLDNSCVGDWTIAQLFPLYEDRTLCSDLTLHTPSYFSPRLVDWGLKTVDTGPTHHSGLSRGYWDVIVRASHRRVGINERDAECDNGCDLRE